MNIADAISKLKTNGALAPNRFRLELTGKLVSLLDNDRLSFACEDIVVPDRGLQTVPNRIYGPQRLAPYNWNYTNEVDLIFRLSSDLYEQAVFEGWQNEVINPNTNNFNYPDEYTGSLKIIVQNRGTETDVYGVELQEVYPLSIGSISLSQATTNEVTRMTVKLAFTKWKSIRSGEFISLSGKSRPENTTDASIRGQSLSRADGITDAILKGADQVIRSEGANVVKRAVEGQVVTSPEATNKIIGDILKYGPFTFLDQLPKTNGPLIPF